ncbi:hypothetical protein SteCoe_39455 [Stentor coeruleus]|uniref:Uncharacterized protein n=1 Tax=Stentor coeruleus TaxID=5963 RepID=A0A1R2AKN2_9CILI|nr:hypothetical protein SteCoe_39455 [Stentor coeruleus]
MGNDPLLGKYHARLLRRLYLLLDYRARRAHYPEPLGAIHSARDRTHPRQDQGLYGHHFRSGRADGEYVPAVLQRPGNRENLPPPVVRVPVHLCQSGHRSQQADFAVPQGARYSGREEDLDFFRSALRSGRAFARVCERTGDPPRGRPAENRARAHGRKHPEQDDEARHWRLRRVQGNVRPLLAGSRQEAVPDPVFHRGPPGHDGSGHAESGAVAEEE